MSNTELDEMREKANIVLARYKNTPLPKTKEKRQELQDWALNEILSLETDTCRIAVVRKKAELPEDPALNYTDDWLRGYREAQQDMLAKHFVEEVKDVQ